MENFSTILQTVWRPAQKNSWGGGASTPPPDRARVNKTCLFIVLVFEEKVNEILTYNAIIVQLILYYYTTLSAVLQLAGLRTFMSTFRTTVCVLYRKPFSLLELGYLIIINLLRSVDHPWQNTVSHAWHAYACLFISVLGAAVTFAAAEQCFFDTGSVSWIVVHCFWHEQPMKPYFHQPPLQLLGRTDQQMLALGLRLLMLSRPARVIKTRWNAHGNANEYVPPAHQYIKSHEAFKWWFSFLSFKYYSRRKTGEFWIFLQSW